MKKTLAEVVAALPEAMQRYDFTQAVYTQALIRITGIRCPEHGEFSQYSGILRRGTGCPQCGHEARGRGKTERAGDFIERVREVHGDTYDYTKTVHKTMHDTITVTCRKHGDFTLKALKHLYSKQGCGLCEAEIKKTRIVEYRHLSASAKISNTAKTFFERCSEAHGGTYTYPEQDYLGAKTNITAECSQHGPFLASAWKHLQGTNGCPSCAVRSSRAEDEVAEFLTSLGVVVERRDRKVLAPKEVDIWLPEYGLGVEYHGLYWHTDNKIGTLHRDKWQLAQDAGVRLIQVFEDEWHDKRAVVESRLRALVGKSERRYARKLSVKQIAWGEARAFLSATHLQGSGTPGRVRLGLFDGAQLVAVATFGASRSGAMTGARDDGVWEVMRYASLGTVVGGFGRLLAEFERAAMPQGLISYCDLRFGDGRLYKATGFSLESVSPPDYWWVPAGRVERVPRYQTQTHKLATHPELGAHYAHGKTERQVCADAGWERISGVGNQRWRKQY